MSEEEWMRTSLQGGEVSWSPGNPHPVSEQNEEGVLAVRRVFWQEGCTYLVTHKIPHSPLSLGLNEDTGYGKIGDRKYWQAWCTEASSTAPLE
jgi:hypothetical protein